MCAFEWCALPRLLQLIQLLYTQARAPPIDQGRPIAVRQLGKHIHIYM